MKIFERLLWISGCVMLSMFLGHLALSEYNRTQSIASFKAAQFALSVAPAPSVSRPVNSNSAVSDPVHSARADGGAESLPLEIREPDQSLWSPGRIASYATSLTQRTSDVVGIFEIPRLGLEVPVYESVSDLHMDRGIARIDGTATPGEKGNMGIAGHRDGYFRVLKDISFGDEIVLTSAQGPQTYLVQQLMIVDPSAVEVLDPTDETSITLVTCYPFYFVGHAPERFIVRAVLQDPVT